MARRKAAQKCKILPWLSARADCKEGRFLQIGNSLLLSEKYQNLSPGSKHLYQCLAMESGGSIEVCFTHGTAKKKYGIPPSSFDRWISELINSGFVIRIQDYAQFSPARFRFVLSWKGIETAPHFGDIGKE